MKCAFYHQAPGSARDTFNRMAVLDICDRCRLEGVFEHLRMRGFGAESRLWVSVLDEDLLFPQGSDGGQQSVLDIHIKLPVDPGIQLGCIKQEWGHHIRKLFRREVEVGDPIFDDYVYVYEGSGAAVTDLLSHEGIQSAVLLVSVQGSFVLEGPRLTTRCLYRIPPTDEDVRSVELEVAAAALHIVDWCITRRGGRL